MEYVRCMLLGLVCVVATGCEPAPGPTESSDSAASPAATAPDESVPTTHEIEAIIQAEKYVRGYLAHPLDAKFPWRSPDVMGNDEIGYRINGTVKAKNAFGAELTQEWLVKLTVVDNAWHLVYCEISGEQMYADKETREGVAKIMAVLAGDAPEPDAPRPRRPPPAPKPTPMRTWTDSTGGFSVEAEFVSMGAGVVKLKNGTARRSSCRWRDSPRRISSGFAIGPGGDQPGRRAELVSRRVAASFVAARET